LHYDLRLQHKGVLLSWAIPKEPPKTGRIKRLAVQVEDHPIEYAKFHGIIPEGMYGAGKVEIWDKGSYELLDYEKDKKMHIKINGRKLKGEYALIHFRPGTKNWLFFKIKS
jgi:DNA ligase D-like protein (predicted 3'-phosphoesterase)